MSIRRLHTGPYQTYGEFEKVFDRAHAALNYATSSMMAQKMGYAFSVPQEFIPKKSDPRKLPHGLTPEEMLHFGLQHGLTFDPLWSGMPYGRPNQGYGHVMVGRPMFPHPAWPILAPQLRPPVKRHDEEELDYRPRLRPF